MKIIGFISKEDPFHDRAVWSGSTFKVREAIEMAGFEVRWIRYGISMRSRFLSFSLRFWNHFLSRRGRWLPSYHFRPLAKSFSKEIDANSLVKECDYLFFPCGAQISLYTKNDKPIINFSDYTIPLILDYYCFNINKKSRAMAQEMDASAARKAFINIRSSLWAYHSLINDYHCEKNTCHVLEFGPNIDTNDIRVGQPYKGGQLRILFSGVDWIRKGGDIAIEVVEILRNKGIDAQLIIAGPHLCPNSCKGKDYIEYVGYLDKNNPEEYQKYIYTLERSHLLLLPTKAECSAIVYSEAAATGLPCYTYLTGGSGDYIADGVNGYALLEGSPANAFAEQIVTDIITDNLLTLRKGALLLYKEKLSWETWAYRFGKIVSSQRTIWQ